MPEFPRPHQELPSSKETPRHVSIVRIPPVGKLYGVEVRCGIHVGSSTNIRRFFYERETSDLLVEVRLLHTTTHEDSLDHDPYYDFLASVRIATKRVRGEIKDVIGFPNQSGTPHKKHSGADIIRMLSEGFSPRTLAQTIGYEVGFMPLDDYLTLTFPDFDLKLWACNEFRLGSNTKSPEEMGALSDELSKYLLGEEVSSIRKSVGGLPTVEGYTFAPLDPSYLPKVFGEL